MSEGQGSSDKSSSSSDTSSQETQPLSIAHIFYNASRARTLFRGRAAANASENDGMSGDEDEDDDYMPTEEEDADESEIGDEECPGTACEGSSKLKMPTSEDKDGKERMLEFLDHPLAQMTRMYTSANWGSKKLRRSPGSLVNALTMLEGREINVSKNGRFSSAECCHLSQRYIPTDGPTIIDRMDSRAYIGQFSEDGSIFIGAYQDQRIRLYNVEDGWSLRKDIIARNLRWTITDTALSPDQRFLVYASITPVVHLVNVGSNSGGVKSLANITDIHEELDFSDSGRAFGLWSLQFSSDGREIVAGSNDNSLYVYDVEAHKRILKLRAHDDDVNAVAFADETSHLLFSGSDDKLCKVWDRRALGSKSAPVGILVGHIEGITHISSKGDGHHLISNCKDQTIKLWDIRKMRDPGSFKKLPRVRLPCHNWDYRWMDYPGRSHNFKHPHDQSLMTYRNHSVLQTLIRAYFSPLYSTGQRYIYTGSSDGFVYIYDLVSGEEVARLGYQSVPVRDCSWHPTLPMLATVSWEGHLSRWDFLRGEKAPKELRNNKLPGFHTLDPDMNDDFQLALRRSYLYRR